VEAKRSTKEGAAMKTAAIYCRVSTEDQEREGTSLQTQQEASLKYCQDKGYELAYSFSEAHSGLVLDKPKLNELRELVRASDIDVIVVYCLDRLSRDPTHGVILTQEFEKHNVTLEAVTEDVDNSELGKLISYIRGFASKLEAEKIKERTVRGMRARAREGRMSGGFHITYGYDYIPVSQKNGGRRVINESEARWVRQIYHWLVNDGLTTSAIRDRLTALSIPSKTGQHWCRASVRAILKNPAYTGRTYAFTSMNHKPRCKPREEWIEIPDATPAIISQELFEAAQKQLQINRDKAMRNTRREYLLRGHVKCRQCGHAYTGGVTRSNYRISGTYRRLYRCSGKQKEYLPIKRCHNKSWGAAKLETLVWQQIEGILKDPALILKEIDKQRQDANQLGILETELHQIERQLRTLSREQEQLLQWALKGFPEETVVSENKRINQKRTILQTQKVELETQIKASQEAVVSLPRLERLVELMQHKISTLDYESKRQALDMLGITVWLDGHTVEITGFIDMSDDVIVTTHPQSLFRIV
jgi:site-specific DNA recombinase